MNPAAPVTSRCIARSVVKPRASAAGLLGFLLQLLDLVAVPLDLLRPFEEVEHAVAAAELEARIREVVARIGLGQRTGPGEAGDGGLEQRQRAPVVARAHQLEAAVV